MDIVLGKCSVMDAFTLLELDGASNSEMRPRVLNFAVENTRGCCLTDEWNKMIARYATSLSRFKLEQQLSFAARVHVMHVQRPINGFNALVKYIEDNDMNQYIKRSEFVTIPFLKFCFCWMLN